MSTRFFTKPARVHRLYGLPPEEIKILKEASK